VFLDFGKSGCCTCKTSYIASWHSLFEDEMDKLHHDLLLILIFLLVLRLDIQVESKAISIPAFVTSMLLAMEAFSNRLSKRVLF
jgi:hypothetical protein